MKERISFSELPAKLIEAVLTVESYVNGCGFDMKLVELIRYRVSQLNGCAYCLDRHYKEGIHAGEGAMRLYSLPVWQETPFYSDKERTALRWADAVTLLTEDQIDDELVESMYEHFSKAELANLTLIVAQINTWNRIAKPFAFLPGEFQAG
ncbi:carboxymuconolactone decarboxylase family protein [Trinickia sp. YCB016]